MTLLELVKSREGLSKHEYWDVLYCADLMLSQDVTRGGYLADMLNLALPEIGEVVYGKLLLESNGITELRVNGSGPVVNMGMYRRYNVFPVFAVFIEASPTMSDEGARVYLKSFKQWVGEDYILVDAYVGARRGYSALLAGISHTSVYAWRTHHQGGRMRVYDNVRTNGVAMVEDITKVLQTGQPYGLIYETGE